MNHISNNGDAECLTTKSVSFGGIGHKKTKVRYIEV